MDLLQKDATNSGDFGMETSREENEKEKEVQEIMRMSNAKQKTTRKEIKELTKELHDYRNENKLRSH